jgi:hypothetical protein
MNHVKQTLMAAAMAATMLAGPAAATTIVAGFNGNTLPGNDDGSTGLVNLGFGFNFFGTTYTQAYVNNNGNVTFDSALSTFTPFSLLTTGRVILAPFFADVDTRGSIADVTYGTGTFNGRDAFGVNWLDVGYYSQRADKLNSFQLVIVDRADSGAGNADIYFNYDQIQWETGEASGGTNGLGGNSARAGYSNGSTTAFELLGSAVNGAFLDGGPNALIDSSNIGVDGRWLFTVRNGVVNPDPDPVPDPVPVPEPASLALLGFGLAAIGFARRRRRA